MIIGPSIWVITLTYALDAEGLALYKEFVSFAVKDTRLAAAMKAVNPPGFDPGLPKNINFTFDNWVSDKMLVGEKWRSSHAGRW